MGDLEPMAESESVRAGFSALIAQVRAGREEAVLALLEQYGPHVVRVVRRRMNPRLRGRFDSQDFTQAVWASFFGHLPEITQLNQPQELVRFLSRVASNKVIDAGRRAQVRHETSADSSSEEMQSAQDLRLKVSEPTPSQHAMARESWDHLLQDESDDDRTVVELRRTGLTQQEIASQLGISERQVRRILTRLSRKVFSE